MSSIREFAAGVHKLSDKFGDKESTYLSDV